MHVSLYPVCLLVYKSCMLVSSTNKHKFYEVAMARTNLQLTKGCSQG